MWPHLVSHRAGISVDFSWSGVQVLSFVGSSSFVLMCVHWSRFELILVGSWLARAESACGELAEVRIKCGKAVLGVL